MNQHREQLKADVVAVLDRLSVGRLELLVEFATFLATKDSEPLAADDPFWDIGQQSITDPQVTDASTNHDAYIYG